MLNVEAFTNIADLLYRFDSFETYHANAKAFKESSKSRCRAACYVLKVTISDKENRASLLHMVKVANCLTELSQLPGDYKHCQKDLLLLVDVVKWSMTTASVADAYKILRKSTDHGPEDIEDIAKLNEDDLSKLCKEWRTKISER